MVVVLYFSTVEAHDEAGIDVHDKFIALGGILLGHECDPELLAPGIRRRVDGRYVISRNLRNMLRLGLAACDGINERMVIYNIILGVACHAHHQFVVSVVVEELLGELRTYAYLCHTHLAIGKFDFVLDRTFQLEIGIVHIYLEAGNYFFLV